MSIIIEIGGGGDRSEIGHFAFCTFCMLVVLVQIILNLDCERTTRREEKLRVSESPYWQSHPSNPSLSPLICLSIGGFTGNLYVRSCDTAFGATKRRTAL